MARPAKSSSDKRTTMLRLRLTTAEKQHLDTIAKEAGFTVSDFIRKLVLHVKPKRSVPNPDREVLLMLLADLHKIGSNLNQIARVLNTEHKSGTPPIGVTPAGLTPLMVDLDGLVRYLHSKLTNSGH